MLPRSFLGLLAVAMRFNGRLALLQSRSHRSCQRNRGNFCLINDIGFDIFPCSSRPCSGMAESVVHLWHQNSFRILVSTSFTITVAENSPAAESYDQGARKGKLLSSSISRDTTSVMRKIRRGSHPPKRVIYPRYKKIFILLCNTGISLKEVYPLTFPFVNPTVLIIIW